MYMLFHKNVETKIGRKYDYPKNAPSQSQI